MRRVELHVLIAVVVALFTVTLAQAAGQQRQNGNAGNQNAGGGRGGGEQAANGRNFGTNETKPSIPPPPGWKTCPRCQNNIDRAEINKKLDVDHHPFNPKDLAGVWGWDGIANAFTVRNMPPMTAWGKKQRDATIRDEVPEARSIVIPTHGPACTHTTTDSS